jgi:hypothetical protein
MSRDALRRNAVYALTPWRNPGEYIVSVQPGDGLSVR